VSVRKDRQGRWVADYYDELGERHAPTFGTKREAQDHERKRRGKRRRRSTMDPGITFDAFADEWLDSASLRVKPQTVDGYRTTLRDHFREPWGRWAFRDVDREAVRQLLASKLQEGYQRSTVGTWLVTLSGMYSLAVDRGLLDANPLRGLGKHLGAVTGNPRARSKRERVKALDSEQLRRFLAETERVGGDLHIAACLMAWAGLRQGEVIALRLSDYQGGMLSVERTAVRKHGISSPKGRPRVVPVSPLLAEVLAGAEGRDWLFPSMVDPRPSVIGRLQGILDRGIRGAGKRIGVEASAHRLRHSFGSQLAVRGVSPAKIQSWMGHEDISTTIGIYGSWFPHTDAGDLTALSEATKPDSTA
jgi:integrase